MKKKCEITVTYQGYMESDLNMDKKIEAIMKKLGARWSGQSFCFTTNTRKIVFNWEIEV